MVQLDRSQPTRDELTQIPVTGPGRLFPAPFVRQGLTVLGSVAGFSRSPLLMSNFAVVRTKLAGNGEF